MITPKEIETKDFTKTKGGGYRPEEVDQFLDEILVDYSHLLEERNALKNKVNLLTEKLTSAVTKEPFAAPAPEPVAPAADDSAARAKAQMLVSDAEDYAKKLIATAQNEAERQNSLARKLSGEIERFRTSLLDLYTAHVEQVKKIPELKYEDVKIGSETLNILNDSFEEPAPAVTASAVSEEAKTAPEENTFVFSAEEVTTPFDFVASPASAAPSRKPAPAAKGLEDLFDDDAKKKKEKKPKRKLFFRDDDEEDEDLFDDDDE